MENTTYLLSSKHPQAHPAESVRQIDWWILCWSRSSEILSITWRRCQAKLKPIGAIGKAGDFKRMGPSGFIKHGWPFLARNSRNIIDFYGILWSIFQHAMTIQQCLNQKMMIYQCIQRYSMYPVGGIPIFLYISGIYHPVSISDGLSSY